MTKLRIIDHVDNKTTVVELTPEEEEDFKKMFRDPSLPRISREDMKQLYKKMGYEYEPKYSSEHECPLELWKRKPGESNCD